MKIINLAIALLYLVGSPLLASVQPNGVLSQADRFAADYRQIEAFRQSQGDELTYREGPDDAVIERWIDLIQAEGWTKSAGLSIHMGRVARLWTNGGSEQRQKALDAVNTLTDRVYADGSVGNVRDEAWVLDKDVVSIDQNDHVFTLRFKEADQKHYDLKIAFFQDGIVHVFGEKPGYFNPTQLAPASLSVSGTPKATRIECVDQPLSALIETQPFALKLFYNGKPVFHQKAFNVAESLSDPRGVRVHFNAAKEDEYLGFGERFGRFRHKGSIFAQWSMGMSAALASGAPETYKPVPFYINPVNSTAMFYNHGGIVRWDLEGSRKGTVDVSSVGGVCDYFLFAGEKSHDVYRAYTKVTGRIFEVSQWVHLPWMGHHFGVKGGGSRTDRLVDELIHFDSYGFTYGAMYATGISPQSEAIKRIYNEYMKPMDIRLGAHLDPLVRPGKAEYNSIPASKREDYIVMREDGSTFISDHAFQSGAAYYDFSTPEVSKHCFPEGLQQICMLDFGEQVGWDGKLSGYPELSGREFHNLYQLLYQRAAFEFHEKRHPNGDWMSFARSGWAGSHAAGGFFAGDHSCSMKDLKSVIRGGINMCAIAGVYWGADIGGYLRATPLTKERYLRWVQFGCFSPLMRTHAHETKEMRPWKYDQETVEVFKYYTWLRAAMVPYVRHCGQVAAREGLPIMRALPIEFPEDENAFVGDQYMFGPSLLVAPYTTEEVHSRKVYLPKGIWYDFFTGKKTTGGKAITQTSPGYREMPVYVKAGSILPVMIGENSHRLGDSRFASSGTRMYTNAEIEAYRIYPGAAGVAKASFSHAAISMANAGGTIELSWTPTIDPLPGTSVHFEVHDVQKVTDVRVNGRVLTATDSWQGIIGFDRYFFDTMSDTLYMAYKYTKTVKLVEGKPQLLISHLEESFNENYFDLFSSWRVFTAVCGDRRRALCDAIRFTREQRQYHENSFAHGKRQVGRHVYGCRK